MDLTLLNQTWVNPFYLQFLGGNFLFLLEEDDRDWFVQSVQQALSVLDATIVDRLLRHSWREQLAGSWFAGLKG